MPTSRQRTAIARIISDLIKADNIIEKEEIEQYKRVIADFNITDEELIKAQDITLTRAMNDIKKLTDDDKNKLHDSLLNTANADNACVAREALILLTLQLILKDTDNKYELLSYDTHGSYTNDKYVIYLESDEVHEINEEIKKEYDHIVNLLKLWKFDFVYLPKVAERFSKMDCDYLQHIIKYMNPRFSKDDIEQLYNKLTHIDTSQFVIDLSNERGQDRLRKTEPSLLINIGTSVVPYCQQNEEGHTYTEFLKIRLDTNENNCVLEEVRRFLNAYQEIITEPEYYRPDRNRDYFKYFGFYKMLFDFMARIEVAGQEIDIHINLTRRTITMQGNEVPLSETELAIYLLILHQTICTHRGGLVKIGRNRTITERENNEITRTIHTIMRFCRDEPYTQQYRNDFDTIRTYISRITRKINDSVRRQDRGHYLPEIDSTNNIYHIPINEQRVYIRQGKEIMSLNDFARLKNL